MKPKILTLLLALALLPAVPAHAAGGGTSLAFNDTLETIYSNLSGPTANIICGCLVICGLIGLAVSRENGWIKGLGGTAIIVACIAKAPALMSQLGLGGASATPHSWLLPILLGQLGTVVVALTFLAVGTARHLQTPAS